MSIINMQFSKGQSEFCVSIFARHGTIAVAAIRGSQNAKSAYLKSQNGRNICKHDICIHEEKPSVVLVFAVTNGP
jgi:hypothetical protein